jgi:aldehyde:ferredoxin oxidoreductase
MRILRVDMGRASITEEPFDQKNYGYLGGRGLTDTILYNECPPTCDPLGPDNVLVFATGYFVGTMMTTSGRISIGAKSPLTHGIKESNVGGSLARVLGEQGVKMLIFKGKPENGEMYYLYIDENGHTSLENASELSGMLNYPLGDRLRAKHGEDIAIASIGPAGERQALVSAIMVTEFKTNHPCRAAARGGLGAVMGSKGIKAVVVKKPIRPYKPTIPAGLEAEFRDMCRAVAKSVTDNPMTGETMPKFGSAAGVGATGPMGALPYLNFSGKRCPEFEKLAPAGWTARLFGQGGRGTIPCQQGCVVRCSNAYHDKDGNYLSAGIEYETLALCGSNLGIFDSDIVVAIDRFCDDYGVDTIDIGAAVGVAMDEGVLPFGDGEGALDLIKSIADENSALGKVLINGCQAMGKHLDAKRIPTGKRQALAAYDPRVLPGFGMTFERSPQGADHTSGSAFVRREDLIPEDQVDLNQSYTAACDCYVCLFAWGSICFDTVGKAAISRAIGILAGLPEGPGPEIIEEVGRHILFMEHSFNKAAGFTMEDDRVADFFYVEPAEATGKPYVSPLKRSYLEIAAERAVQQE